ncbi:MAG TPA: TIGR03619 family F420-dependent LLM class oxidoreductase [Gaiellaceae bacterium]|nr:TIGR03619 family F420-dependent LLM class oxidoreductase [Gaiellaceae bacterium]
MLYQSAQFEHLIDEPWVAARVEDAVAEIVADADAAFDSDALWPAHEWDGWRTALPLKNLYVGAAGVVWALAALRPVAESRLDLPVVAVSALERWRAKPDFMEGEVIPTPGEAALFLGETGALLVSLLLAPAAVGADRLHDLVLANRDNETNEIFWGAPGTLLAAVAMRDATGEERWEKAARELADALVARRDDEGLWTQHLWGQDFMSLGASHGAVANVRALLRIDDHPRNELLRRETAALLARHATREDGFANWTDEPKLPMFANVTRRACETRSVRYGLFVANVGAYADPRNVVRLAQAAEASGWEALFLWDHLAFVWGLPAADPWVTLGAVAVSTHTMLLGPAVTPVARRRPHVVAHAVATLDTLSGGRVIFGAGLGGVTSEFAAFGEDADERVRAERLDEALGLLRRWWKGESVEHAGPHYNVAGVTLKPLPIQQPLPIWVGGNSPAALRRAARFDGWVADTADPSCMTMTADELARNIAEIGRDEGFDVAVHGYSDSCDPAAYAQAGATWWLEDMHDMRASFDDLLLEVVAGPPSPPQSTH